MLLMHGLNICVFPVSIVCILSLSYVFCQFYGVFCVFQSSFFTPSNITAGEIMMLSLANLYSPVLCCTTPGVHSCSPAVGIFPPAISGGVGDQPLPPAFIDARR